MISPEERIALVLEALGYVIDPVYVRYVLAGHTFESLEEACYTVLYNTGNGNAEKELDDFFGMNIY